RAPGHRRHPRCPRQRRETYSADCGRRERAHRDHAARRWPRDGCLMLKRPTIAADAGLLPKSDERPPLFAFAVSHYRSDLLIRGLVDLAMSGLVILAFTGNMGAFWQPVRLAAHALMSAIQRPAGETRTNAATQFTRPAAGPGEETLIGIGAPDIPDAVVEKA